MNERRVTKKLKNPNLLFVQWLTEWKEKAIEKESKMQHCFSIALRSLKKYPLPLETGSDCKILNGFGEKLCKMLDDKLKEHRINPAAQKLNPSPHVESRSKKVPKKRVLNKEKTCNMREYIPKAGSGPFAILVTLYQKSLEHNYVGYLTKNEIITHGQHLCDVSFTKPQPDSRYTGWSSMKTLLDKKLISKKGNPAQFSLTKEGCTLGEKLYIEQAIDEFDKQENVENVTAQNVYPPTDSLQKPPNQSGAPEESVIFMPNSFQIILLVDTQEVKGDMNDPILCDLRKLSVCHEVRNLKIGDYLWICRDNNQNELVLPYIIERKRMDDFGSSIKDDRFHEQKFRLKQCGLANLIYLIESYGKNQHVGLPITTLYQAATNTLIQDDFSVKFTEDGRGTCEYLASLTYFLKTMFQDKILVSRSKLGLPRSTSDNHKVQLMDFRDFNRSSSKTRNFKVKEMFIKHLLQIKGMSLDKALAIVEKYQAPKILKLSYSEMNHVQAEKLLSNIRYGNLQKNIGPALSKTVYQFFCKDCY